MRFRAIVFDLDDTLYAERNYTLSGFRAVGHWAAATYGLSATQCFAELCELFDGGARGNTFDRWLESKSLAGNGRVEEMVAVFRDHDPSIRLDETVAELLVRLRQRFSLGMVTDGYLGVQRKKAAALGLDAYLDVVVFSDELGRAEWKPSVLPFLTVLDRLAVPSHAAVYVADNPAKDFFGARAAGMATIRVRASHGVYGHLEARSPEWAPDAEIVDLMNLERALIELELIHEVKG